MRGGAHESASGFTGDALYTPTDCDSGTEWFHPHLSHTLVAHPPRVNVLHKHGSLTISDFLFRKVWRFYCRDSLDENQCWDTEM